MCATSLEWGSVSDWVSGIATLGALIVAIAYPIREEKRRQQIRRTSVYGWLEIAAAQSGATQKGYLHLDNRTDLPLYKWQVTIQWDRAKSAKPIVYSVGQNEFGIIPPGKHTFPLSAGTELPANDTSVKVAIDFQDESGKLWTRLATGELRSKK